MRIVRLQRTSSLPLVVQACALALVVAGCTMRDANLAPGAGAPSYSPANAAPPQLSVAADELVGPVWHWQRTRTADGGEIVAAAPDRYTLKFEGGGRVLLRADCNRGSGGYEVNGATMKMTPAALTRMGCPPGTQDSEFAAALPRVTRYAIAAGELTLTLSDGATMRLRSAP